MRIILKTLGSSVFIGFLIILPFMIMKVVNWREQYEECPILLYISMWLNMIAINVILPPIVRGRRTGNYDLANLVFPIFNKHRLDKWYSAI
jgi:hypothetical protein